MAEALKVQTQREAELAEGKRRLEGLPTSSATSCPRDRRIDASSETSLKQQVELLLQEVAALKVRVRSPASRSTETVLVPIARSGSALMSELIEEADKKRPRVSGELTH